MEDILADNTESDRTDESTEDCSSRGGWDWTWYWVWNDLENETSANAHTLLWRV